MKKERQARIREIIKNYRIDTQDELIRRLGESGISATQATVSRDIKDLKLTKISDGSSGYYYALPSGSSSDIGKLNASLTNLIVSVTSAMNIIVIRTHPGMAQAVATGIDNIRSSDILGCVAGDDTIFVATPSEDVAASLGTRIKALMLEDAK